MPGTTPVSLVLNDFTKMRTPIHLAQKTWIAAVPGANTMQASLMKLWLWKISGL